MAIASGQAVIRDTAPTAGTATALTASTGQPLPAASIIGSFTDANTAAAASDFTATIDWGDGSPTSVGSVVAGTAAGSFNVEATHTYAKPNATVIQPTIVVHEIGGSTITLPTTDTATITVTDAARDRLDQELLRGRGPDTGTFVLATFTDPNTLATVANVTATLGRTAGATARRPATVPGSLVSSRSASRR